MTETLELTIPQPAKFYSAGDEEAFFAWLKSTPGIKEVVGTPEGLVLTITTPVQRAALYELIALLTRFGIDIEVLKVLVTATDAEYFKDPKKYWHRAMFASEPA